MSRPPKPSMPLLPALKVLAGQRSDEVVVTSMGALREWPALSQHPLDFHYFPSAMGQLPALSLGLALAQPARHVIGIVGDGSLLMNLGTLATIKASGAINITLILLDNKVYEVTGGQQTASAAAGFDFAAAARASGWPSVAAFDNLAAWQAGAAAALSSPGPRFISLAVEPVRENFALRSPGPPAPRLAQFRQAFQQCV